MLKRVTARDKESDTERERERERELALAICFKLLINCISKANEREICQQLFDSSSKSL